jgi:hypothetical protein
VQSLLQYISERESSRRSFFIMYLKSSYHILGIKIIIKKKKTCYNSPGPRWDFLSLKILFSKLPIASCASFFFSLSSHRTVNKSHQVDEDNLFTPIR